MSSTRRVSHDVAMIRSSDPVADAEAPSRTRNRWGQGDRLRTEILEAAGQLLGELGGVDGLSLRGVARQVGITPASIYAHFADKADLVAAGVDYGHGRLVARIREAGATVEESDPVGRARAQLHAFCWYTVDNPGLYRLLFGPTHRPDGVKPTRSIVGLLIETMHACEVAGTRLRLPAERAAIVLIVGAHGRVALQLINSGSDRVEQVIDFADELLALVVEGTDRST